MAGFKWVRLDTRKMTTWLEGCNPGCILYKAFRREGNLADSSTQPIPALENRHLKAMLQENIGTAQPREPSADDAYAGQATQDLRSALTKM